MPVLIILPTEVSISLTLKSVNQISLQVHNDRLGKAPRRHPHNVLAASRTTKARSVRFDIRKDSEASVASTASSSSGLSDFLPTSRAMTVQPLRSPAPATVRAAMVRESLPPQRPPPGRPPPQSPSTKKTNRPGYDRLDSGSSDDGSEEGLGRRES